MPAGTPTLLDGFQSFTILGIIGRELNRFFVGLLGLLAIALLLMDGADFEIGVGFFGINLRDFFESLQSLLGAIFFLEYFSPDIKIIGIVRPSGESLLNGLICSRKITVGIKKFCELRVRVAVRGILFEGLIEQIHRLRKLVLDGQIVGFVNQVTGLGGIFIGGAIGLRRLLEFRSSALSASRIAGALIRASQQKHCVGFARARAL